MLTTGATAAAVVTTAGPVLGPWWLAASLGAMGALSAVCALKGRDGRGAAWWLAVGLCLVGWRGLIASADHLRLEQQLADNDPSIRARVVIAEGWRPSRWGSRCRIRITSATVNGIDLPIEPRGDLEVRGTASAAELPAPGAVATVLARVRGSPTRPLLVVSSPRLVRPTAATSAFPTLRDRLLQHLLGAAGTDIDRIRAAETAAALALGRRDAIPTDRRERWRRSGLAHVLAVSGLHVGLVGVVAWVLATRFAPTPTAARWIVMAVLPGYAMLAGASPSALRAALMAVIYLGSRMLGRAILPMAAVLLAAFLLLFGRPSLVFEPGFQLTVLITAALVRWVPPLARWLPGPHWLAGAVAVPLVAQLAALPLVAWHFRTLIPGALVSNIAGLPLIAPTVLFSVTAAAVAQVSASAAAVLLELVHLLSTALLWMAAAARATEVVTPAIPLPAIAALVVCGWLALHEGRSGRIGGAVWIALMVATGAWMTRGGAAQPSVELLPISDGAAVVLRDGDDTTMIDSGRYPLEAARLLADTRVRRLSALVATHTDEDHIGGAVTILSTLDVECLLMPAWMARAAESVPLLRAARRRGVRPVRVARGVTTSAGAIRIDFLWPPLTDPPSQENERSIVARAILRNRPVLLTSDIGRPTEIRLSRLSSLACDVLVIPHHGSRGSTSSVLLERAGARIALIPASKGNQHGHPHRDVLDRLHDRRVTARWPARHGACGAIWSGTVWEAYP
jgi:competence protein ComEC